MIALLPFVLAVLISPKVEKQPVAENALLRHQVVYLDKVKGR